MPCFRRWGRPALPGETEGLICVPLPQPQGTPEAPEGSGWRMVAGPGGCRPSPESCSVTVGIRCGPEEHPLQQLGATSPPQGLLP